MKILSLVAVLLAVFSAPAFAQNKAIPVPPRNSGTPASDQTVLPFNIELGRIVLTVLVNGKPTRMILDTGAQEIGVTRVPNPLGMATIQTWDGTSSRVTQGEVLVTIGDIGIGTMALEAPWCHKTGLGIIGQSVLSQFRRVIIDYDTHTVTFEPRPR